MKKRVSDIIGSVDVLAQTGGDVNVTSLALDSRVVEAGGLFFAVRGTQADGHRFIGSAVERGAAAVVCEQMPEHTAQGVTYIQVADSAAAVGLVAAAFYGNPSTRMKIVGVTGTNGKTTTATLLYDLFLRLGYRAGLVSTIAYRIGEGAPRESTHTNPDAIRLQALMAEMVDAGCEYCFMEVSSHGVVQHRTAGVTFTGGVFTNLTHDHLDYHGTFAEYLRAKKRFFDTLPAAAFALTNADDRNGSVMVQNTRARTHTYSLRHLADFQGRIIEMLIDGMLLRIDGREAWMRFIGRFNAYNLLAVYGAAVLLGAEREDVLRELSGLGAVDGRFEVVRSERGVTAIIDYAHTPDALTNVLATINEIRTVGGGQKLYVVVGCGGNRDAAKRPEMAHIAASESDLAIFTSDNPRLEDSVAIIEQMKAGVQSGDRYIAIADRREAIRAACAMAAPGDIILVAGKGHETYQDAGGVKTHFDDKEEIILNFARAHAL
ncbi:MAG: UDP-N-acetylmuramoyl-L-alanyl-D-glutamate--2,6-diaminopimelate ligase [Rikenellaceae bacterium]|nr:UDP-N-acetylmuramoyl-L-alanyl-D-glutamate--2,6-diaminopimelate ligase [Rikenellaceae bacterium]MCL2692333.1 UDP-N-acetylmuramoyl-L-alanyl-D-glutamate--2,6-diaminopimelate ligase [Rikenellaceae bacterium]